MYRNIDCKFWTDPKVRALEPQARYLFLYFVTNPHTHMSGFYYLPRPLAMHETGLSDRVYDTLCHTLSDTGTVLFDRVSDTVFLPKMMRYQALGEKNLRAAEAHAHQFSHSRLYPIFCKTYGLTAHPDDTLSYTLSDRVSDTLSPQDQDQYQDQRSEAEETAAETAPAAAAATPAGEIVAAWNEIVGKPSVKSVTAERRRHLKARIASGQAGAGLDWWREFFARVAASRYLAQGHNWFCFDWAINEQNMAKILEGRYDEARSGPIPITSPRHVSRELTHEEFLASMPPGMRERTLAAEKAAQEETACAL